METVDVYLNILRDIDSSSIDISDWEAGFIESILKRNPSRLTDKQIAVINRMKDKYLSENYVPYNDGLDDIPF